LPPETYPTADVSVIVPAYRAARTIVRALSSVASQSVKPREVIVVDDGSDDGTFEAASSLMEAMSGVELKLIAQEKAGAGAARNKALAEAKGEYVAFLDADDEWTPEKIERSMAVIANSGDVLVAHDYRRIQADGSERIIDCVRRFKSAVDPFVGLYRQGYIATSSVIVRRDAVRVAGNFDENLATAQDFDLWLKILGKPGATFSVFPEALLCYHISPGSISTFTARRLGCTLRIAERHFPALVGRKGRALVSLGFRVCAVHFEAFSAYRAVGRPLAAIAVVLGLPWQLLRSFMNTPGTEQSAPTWLKSFLWLWVILGCGAYVYRFAHLGRAFITMVKQL